MPSPPSSERLLTGDRPTGPLHLGHLVGSLRSRVALQERHECFILVADLHALTTHPRKEDIARMSVHVRAVVEDLLAVGIDPERTTIYLQSAVPAVYDLAVLLQMIAPRRRLEGLTTLQTLATTAGVPEDGVTMGLLGYPVLQAADILMARAHIVPVGQDNVEHVDVARELAAAFNDLYGELFPIPRAHVSNCPSLPGVDLGLGGCAHKMSKSLGNAVALRDPPEVVRDKLGSLRLLPNVPLEEQPLLAFARAFLPGEDDDLAREVARGTLSEAALREKIVAAVLSQLAPIAERRAEIAADPGRVEEVLVDGTIRAREVAYTTLQAVREAMGLEPAWQELVDVTERRVRARKRPHPA